MALRNPDKISINPLTCPSCQGGLVRCRCAGALDLPACLKCRHVWLKDEDCRQLALPAGQLSEAILKSSENGEKTSQGCPSCKNALRRGLIGKERSAADVCFRCTGVWLSTSILKILVQEWSDTGAPRKTSAKGNKLATLSSGAPAAAVGMLKLPALGLTSLAVLTSLYGLVFAAVVFFVERGNLYNPLGLVILLGVIGLQFFLGPRLMDMSLRWMGSLKWLSVEEVPDSLGKWIFSICQKENIPFPRLGLIEDGAPNAFTYGTRPGDARLVITRGILDQLTEAEARAVVTHELGHIVHRDFLFMTFAQLIPILFYQIYRMLSSGKRRSESADQKGSINFAVIAYAAYILSQYVVLFLSRLREYWADRYSVDKTRDPDSLSSALVKVGYGLAKGEAKGEKGEPRAKKLRAIQAMGIADASRSALLGFYAAQAKAGSSVEAAMAWDLTNPWSRLFELQSTHPMTAKRIRAIAAQGRAIGLSPKIDANGDPQSAIPSAQFLMEVIVHYLPMIGLVGFLLMGKGLALKIMSAKGFQTIRFLWLCAQGFSLGSLIRLYVIHRADKFRREEVVNLLTRADASPVNTIPVVVEGKIIGRGIPGYVFCEDMVLQDQTGFVLLDYRRLLPFSGLFFRLFRADRYLEKDVVVEGWFRRCPMPYIEVRRIRSEDGAVSRSYRYPATMAGWGLLLVFCLGVYFL